MSADSDAVDNGADGVGITGLQSASDADEVLGMNQTSGEAFSADQAEVSGKKGWHVSEHKEQAAHIADTDAGKDQVMELQAEIYAT